MNIAVVVHRTVKTKRLPDIVGFIKSMKKMGAKVSRDGSTIVIDFRHSRENIGGRGEQ